MSEHDSDWYDNGPGSESFNRDIAKSQREATDEAWEKTKCPHCGQQWRIFGPCRCVEPKTN